MNLFISHSQSRSQRFALVLESVLRKAIHNLRPWMSKTGTDQGVRWSAEIAEQLNKAHAGIVVVTEENRSEPWLLFEAGALSVKPIERVWTLLLDLDAKQVQQPLGAFQHTAAEKGAVRALALSIHAQMIEHKFETNPRSDVEALFDFLWDKEVEPVLNDLRMEGSQMATPKRTVEDMVGEVLDHVRTLSRREAALREARERLVRETRQRQLGFARGVRAVTAERGSRGQFPQDATGTFIFDDRDQAEAFCILRPGAIGPVRVGPTSWSVEVRGTGSAESAADGTT